MGKRGPKPTELTPEQRSQVRMLAKYHSIDEIAALMGVGRSTFYRMMERDPSIRDDYDKGKAELVGAAAKTLAQKALEGDNTCLIFLLKTQGRWSERQQIEHTGRDGGPIETVDRTAAREHLARELARIASRQVAGELPGEST